MPELPLQQTEMALKPQKPMHSQEQPPAGEGLKMTLGPKQEKKNKGKAKKAKKKKAESEEEEEEEEEAEEEQEEEDEGAEEGEAEQEEPREAEEADTVAPVDHKYVVDIKPEYKTLSYNDMVAAVRDQHVGRPQVNKYLAKNLNSD